ncbi:MAG: ATP-binding cassette domain-containing protein [Bdellovibrionales bacterium]|nr:ATP-binding cassette domain-containing protein [Bdellovibrionales bacterium]
MYNLHPFSYSYGKSGKTKKIFLEKEIVLSKNEVVAIVGPSGGGKSTLLKVLKGIIPEYSSGILEGEISFLEKPLTGLHFQENLQKILYLFQNPFSQLIYPSPEEEFLFSMENFNFTKEEMDKERLKFEESFNLKNIWGKKTADLSNGECQKLVLASLLAINPQVLLLDEPTAFLDPEARREFYSYLETIKRDRLVVLVDHHVKEIKNVVTKVLEVSIEGKITQRDSIDVITEKEITSLDLATLKFIHPSQSLKLSGVNFSFDKKNPLLKDLNVEFYGGEIIAIKGRNGVGKSTLFKLISGILKPKSGKISMGKEKIFSKTGFIFQNPETHFFFDTIEEELKQSFKHINSLALQNDLLKRFFYKIDLNKSPFLLSEGEKRRLSILMTVFLGKSLILYDEPTFGQDQDSIHEIESLMKELKSNGLIQIYISHDDDFIKKTADRVFTLESGVLYEIS